MSDKEKGIYRKYTIERVDKSPKHVNCVAFVLDMDHDPFAVPALAAYAEACRRDGYMKLADDLESFVRMKHKEQDQKALVIAINEAIDQMTDENREKYKIKKIGTDE